MMKQTRKGCVARLTLASLTLMLVLSGCGKSVQVGDADGSMGPDGSPGPNARLCALSDRVRWSFVQPQPDESRTLDLLFVADTSDSMSTKREKVAQGLSSFLSQLPSKTDYRIAVMLAHGLSSNASGRLYSAPGSQKVLDSRKQTVFQIQSQLQASLSQVTADRDDANGEALMSSFLRSLEPARQDQIRSQGFFRDNAALSVIFISDENDICYPPEQHGFNAFPDFVSAPDEIEERAYQKNCLNPDGSERVTPQAVLSGLASLKPDQGFSVGGVIHVDGSRVPKKGEESIGHGVLELTRMAAGGFSMDIADKDYSSGLSSLGAQTALTLRLQTSFSLTGSIAIDPSSLRVRVDAREVGYSFDPIQATTRIDAREAGSAGSLIEIDACRR